VLTESAMPWLCARARCFTLLLLLPILLLVLAGCADERLPPGKVKLVVWGLAYGEETKGLEARVKEFEKRHPNIVVSILSMGAGTMNPQKLMTAIVGNVPPDVIQQDRFTIGDWASRETFLPLDKYIKRDRNNPDGVRSEDYYKACWEEATYRGSVFAIPYGTDDRALFYNRTLFRQAGLEPDKPPRTWEELKTAAKALTKPTADGTSYDRIGFIPNYGNSWLYLYAWQNGGEFMSPDGHTCIMDAKPNVEALQYMVDVYDLLGGYPRVNAFQAGFQTNDLDPFLTGKVAMKIDGNWVLNNIARYGPDIDFAVAPAPVPQERLDELEGRKPLDPRFRGQPKYITWAGGFSLAIPRGAQHPDEAWEFVKWMSGVEAALIESEAQKAYNLSKERPYVPNISANRKVNEAVFAKFAPQTEKFSKALKLFMDMLDQAKFRPVTFVGQRLWDEHARAFELAVDHNASNKTPQQVMTEGTKATQVELDKVFNRDKFALLDMRIPIAIATVLGLAFLTFAAVKLRRILRMGELMRREALAGYLFASPWIFGFIALTAGPIITALFLSLCDYDVLHPPRFVGANNYATLFGVDSYYLGKALGNAAYLACIGIPLGICTGLSIAMLLNAKVGGMSGYRTAFYVPSIVPIVASAVLWAWILNGDPNRGLLNAVWKATITNWLHVAPPGWLGAAEWAKPALIIHGLWGAGSGMILWLAGLQGIPQHLYEAADIDGAGLWARFKAVTLPMLSPYIFYNLIMGVINTLQEFDRIYILSRQGTGSSSFGPVDSMLVPVVYLFTNAFKYFKMGYASAVAWVLFIVILALTAIQLKLAPRWVHYEAEKK
jgi:ABC-type sugar transport systems, permease components